MIIEYKDEIQRNELKLKRENMASYKKKISNSMVKDTLILTAGSAVILANTAFFYYQLTK